MKKHEDFVDNLTFFTLKQRWKVVYPPVQAYVRAKIEEQYQRALVWQDQQLLDEGKRNTFAHQAIACKVILDFLDELEKSND